MIGYDTYLHVDAFDRGLEAGRLISKLVKGEVSPAVEFRQPEYF